MPTQVISASGTNYGLVVNSDGSINTTDNVAPNVGFNFETELIYMVSGTGTGVTGSEIGSIVKHYDAGSFVRVLTYENNQVINVGSWI